MCDWKRWGVLIVLLGLGSLGGCVANPATGSNSLILISDATEQLIGQRSATAFETRLQGRVANEQLQSYIQQVGSKIAAASDRRIAHNFVVVDSPVPNSFALGGGHIYITAGMMRRLDNEAQLAAVLAHEVAHVAARHHLQALQRIMGTRVLDIEKQLTDEFWVPDMVDELVSNVTYVRYNSREESEADGLGAAYMIQAGYDPWGMIELLDVLEKTAAQQSENAGISVVRTHPVYTDRIRMAKRSVRAIFGPPIANRSSDRITTPFLKMRALLK